MQRSRRPGNKLSFARRRRRFAVHFEAFDRELYSVTKHDSQTYQWWIAVVTGIMAAAALAAAVQVWAYPYPRAIFLNSSLTFITLSSVAVLLFGIRHVRNSAELKARETKRRGHRWWRHTHVLSLLLTIFIIAPCYMLSKTLFALRDCVSASELNACNVSTSDMDRDKEIEIDAKIRRMTGFP